MNNDQDKFQVTLSIEVQDIQDIVEVDSTFQVPFILSLSWKDARLTYKNLKSNLEQNLLSETEMDEIGGIWIPTALFRNTNEKHTTVVDKKTYTKIKRLDGPGIDNNRRSLLSNHENTFLHNGAQHLLIMDKYYREIFRCE